MTESTVDRRVRIGVLALQGSFREHMASLQRFGDVQAVEVRTQEQLRSVDGLIIPGGESTTMALVAQRWGLIPDLRSFCAAAKPVWGTCAGMIFLADRATGQKQGGQALLGGLDCLVQRNFFGAQIHSFEAQLPSPPVFRGAAAGGAHADGNGDGNGSGGAEGNGSDGVADEADKPYRAVFIRAPGILECGPDLDILSEYHLTEEEQAQAEGVKSVAVAVRKGHLLATAFHPELTDDIRCVDPPHRRHKVFVDMVRAQPQPQGAPRPEYPVRRLPSNSNRPGDIPVYSADLASQW